MWLCTYPVSVFYMPPMFPDVITWPMLKYPCDFVPERLARTTAWSYKNCWYLTVFAESIERRPCMWEIKSSVPSRVKRMTYKMYTCDFLAWHFVLIGLDKDWLAQCQGNVIEWDIRSWCWQPYFPVEQHYKVAICAHCHKSVPVLMWP